MDIGQIIKDMIADNKENFEDPLYENDGYAIAYVDGYNDSLVDLLNKLGIKHNEELRYGMPINH